jgi:hypothetical protein
MHASPHCRSPAETETEGCQTGLQLFRNPREFALLALAIGINKSEIATTPLPCFIMTGS